MTNWSSDIQSAFPFSYTGFFEKVLMVLINLSAKTVPKGVFLQ